MKFSPAPTWFRDAVVDGLKVLRALNLKGTPGKDLIKKTGEVWIQTLWNRPGQWREEDRDRLDKAFITLATKIDAWPAPVQLLRELPARREHRALPSPGVSPEKRQRAMQHVSTILEHLGRTRREV